MTNRDISTSLTHQLSAILEDCRRIEPALQSYLKTSDERPDINFELLRVLSNALSAYELLVPDKEVGEFHGLPREACTGDEAVELEIRHAEQNAECDFQPWLCEKLNRLQTAAKGLVAYWLTEPSSVELHKEAPTTARDWLRQTIAPFVVTREEDEDDAYFSSGAAKALFRIGHKMEVLALEEDDVDVGVTVKVREKGQIGNVPLADLEVKPKPDKNFWPVREYVVWFANRC